VEQDDVLAVDDPLRAEADPHPPTERLGEQERVQATLRTAWSTARVALLGAPAPDLRDG
jgi:hypothetical protein